MDERWLTVDDICKYLNVSNETVYKWIEQRAMPGHRGENDDLVSGLVEVVREMRHKGTSIMVASQDPPSVPVSLIELSSQIIMYKYHSPAWLKDIQNANAALGELTSDKMSHLGTGEAYGGRARPLTTHSPGVR